LNSISAFIYVNICINQIWLWNENLDSFEVIDGLSRIVKLIPEKLSTAIEISQENLPNPQDDGSFLIVLVSDLLKFYQDLVHKQTLKNLEGATDLALQEADEKIVFEEVKGHRNIKTRPDSVSASKTELVHKPEPELEPEPELIPKTEHKLEPEPEPEPKAEADADAEISDIKAYLTIEEVLHRFSQNLITFKESLRQRILSQTLEGAKVTLTLAENIQKACYVYLDFLHPVYLQIKRQGVISDSAKEQLKSKVDEKLKQNDQKLTNEFESITGFNLKDY
jgi:hypothetical protein